MTRQTRCKNEPTGDPGDCDLDLLKLVRDSGYRAPIGILGHRTDQDAEVTLKTNLEGLERLLKEMNH